MESTPTTTVTERRACAVCGAQLSHGARFCHRCGTAVSAGPRPAPTGAATVLPWGVAALALIALISLLAGQFFGGRDARGAQVAEPPEPAPMRAPDISSMSPQERADRLYDRVMLYSEQGRADSAQFFVPMAIGALEAVTPRTVHTRYDLGRMALIARDVAMATAEADTILKESPTHLLGLVLA